MDEKVSIRDNVGVIIQERPKKDKKEQEKTDADIRDSHNKNIRQEK
jgi:hypothetical protein